MFTYDFVVRFVLDRSVVIATVQFESNVSDFDYDEDSVIDLATEMVLEDGIDVSNAQAVDVELQGVYGGLAI